MHTMEAITVNKTGQLEGHVDALYSLMGSSDASHFYSGGSDRLIVEWDLLTLNSVKVAAKATTSVYAISYIADSSLLIIGNKEGGIHVVDLKNNTPLKHLQFHTKPVFEIKYSPKHNYILACAGDGVVSIWNAADFSLISTFKNSDAAARAMAVHPDQNEFAVGYSDNTIKIVDLETFELKHVLESHTSSVFCLQYSPDGTYLLSGSRDAHLKAWSPKENYALYKDIVAHLFTINSVVYHPSGKYFATGSRDKTIKIWNAENFKLLKVIDKVRNEGHSHSVNKLLWTSFNDQLVSCGDDKLIMSWGICLPIV